MNNNNYLTIDQDQRWMHRNRVKAGVFDSSCENSPKLKPINS